MSVSQFSTNGSGEQTPEVENVIVIGSGPAGFTAGLYTARANLSPLLLTGNDFGGQVSITYEVENYPGFPEGISGPDLIDKMKQQAEKFGTRIEYDYVQEIETDTYPFVVRTANDKEYKSKTIILATGARPRYLEVPGEKEYTGRGVSYCATCDGFFFTGKDVVVVGGGDSAIEEALFLTKFATRVRVIHRRDELRASKILQDRAMANEKVEIVWDAIVTEILGSDEGKVTGVTIQNPKTGETDHLDTDGVFIFIGHLPNNELYTDKLQMDEDGHLIIDRFMRTNVPGIFAAGEIADKVFKQVATSAGQGCSAALQTEKFMADVEDQGYPGFADPREFYVPVPMTA